MQTLAASHRLADIYVFEQRHQVKKIKIRENNFCQVLLNQFLKCVLGW